VKKRSDSVFFQARNSTGWSALSAWLGPA